ncbi:hypothetical protein ACFE04_016915 [Oxalis oulophora]
MGFFLVLVILMCMPSSAIDHSLAGLAVTFGLNLNVLQAWVIWNLCDVENKMISVERVLQFSEIKSEASLVIDNCRPRLGIILDEGKSSSFSPAKLLEDKSSSFSKLVAEFVRRSSAGSNHNRS